MLAKFFRHKIVQIILLLFIIAGILLVIFPPDQLKWIENHGSQIMLGYLFLGLCFLFLRQQRLLFFSFFACAILCVFLKSTTNSALSPPSHAVDVPHFKIAHFNMNNASDSLANAMQTISNLEADILSFQEVTPFWKNILTTQFSEKYPYYYLHPDLGLFGMGVFSKFPLDSVGLFMYEEVPNISGIIQLSEKNSFHFISSHTHPALNSHYLERLREQLDTVAQFCNQNKQATIVFGDFHVVPWSNEMQLFKEKTQLKDSRRGFMPTVPHGSITFLEAPKDHILFSGDFECLKFETISSAATSHLGIQATFQLKPPQDEHQGSPK